MRSKLAAKTKRRSYEYKGLFGIWAWLEKVSPTVGGVVE